MRLLEQHPDLKEAFWLILDTIAGHDRTEEFVWEFLWRLDGGGESGTRVRSGF